MADNLVLTPPAKINLYLKVLGRREDGYHLLATLMQKIDLCDTITLSRTETPGIHLQCPDSSLPENKENIVYRTAELFFEEQGNVLSKTQGVTIVLQKKIPVAAGLGGGSSDAAAVLRGLNRLFHTGCGPDQLAEMGLRLGADVPLFVHDWPVAWATGIGEQLSPARGLDDGWLLLVNPDFPVSTKWVYENLALTAKEKKINLKNSHCNVEQGEAVSSPDRPFLSDDLHNDLEQVTIQKYQEIDRIKKQLLQAGAQGALMSGSGPTVFAIFREQDLDLARQCQGLFLKTYKQVYLVRPLANGNS